jgi:CO/xanthine dehydrogenase FAD-binding subunit
VVSPEEFFLTYFTTAIEPAEIVTQVWFPALPEGTGSCFTELSRRAGDFAIVGVAATLTLEGPSQISESRISLIGVGGTPHRAPDLLAGKAPGEVAFAEAASAIAGEIEPESDLHATAAYRKHLAEVLTRRALATALERATTERGGEGA